MRLFRKRAILALAAPTLFALLALGCGGDDDDDSSGGESSLSSPEATGAQEGATGSEGAEGTFTVEEMTALAATEVEGYEVLEPTVGSASDTVTVGYTPVEGGSGLEAAITLAPCDPFICWDLDSELGPEEIENLKSNLAPVHIENPDLVFEYGNIELAPGYEGFFLYSRSFVQDGGSTATSNGYRVTYHDGVNILSIIVNPEFGPTPASAGELEMLMDQSKGELAAKNFFAAYADAFEPTE